MKIIAATVLLTFCCVPSLLAQDAAPADGDKGAAIAKYEGDVNDATTLRKYAGGIFGDIARTMNKDADAAEAQLNALEKFATNEEITDEDALKVKKQITSAVDYFRGRLELARASLEDLKKSLVEKPDRESVQKYIAKLSQELSSAADKDPQDALKQLEAAKKFLEELAEKNEDEIVKRIASSSRGLASIERNIEGELKLAELIGKQAPPLNIKDWANGEPLTDGDLKGKVVLLDFWAVWCGPCIATFPHLREWQEEYGDKGLEIIGLTRYYNMKWDDEAGRATRSKEAVEPEVEQEMLAKFAEEHNLKHRFGIQEDRTLSEFYAVSGIPHVVLIDREGKVRLVKVGAGESNAQQIEAEIKKLIAG